MKRILPDRTKDYCIIPFCDGKVTPRYGIPLCHEHILFCWSVVEEDRRKTGQAAEALLAECQPESPQGPPKGRGFIYYLQMGDYIKIGYTKNLDRRMRQYPPNAELLAANRGTPDDEKHIHQKFTAFLDSGREWYRDAPEIRRHIARAEQRSDSVNLKELPSRKGNAKPKAPVRPRATPTLRIG